MVKALEAVAESTCFTAAFTVSFGVPLVGELTWSPLAGTLPPTSVDGQEAIPNVQGRVDFEGQASGNHRQ
jgi:hypothetical protein